MGCIWTKQIQMALYWFDAFCAQTDGPLQRVFTLSAYLRTGTAVDIYTDASPWGMGGWLCVDGVPTEYFTVPRTKFDFSFFGYKKGDCKGQQCWEAYAILVAIRLWKHVWQHVRARLSFFADNVTARTALAIYKAKHSTGVSRIAREMALEFADAEFAPDFSNHLPGISNGVADSLSRQWEPKKAYTLPATLLHAQRREPEARNTAYFRSLRPPRARMPLRRLE